MPHNASPESDAGNLPPRLFAGLPGTGGVLKQSADDFQVEEIPVYEPSGTGEHLFLWIEKRDVSADQLSRHLARTLGVPHDEIGMAGLKDKTAVTRQYVSVPVRCEGEVSRVDTELIRVLRSARHENKLKTGHLRGNRFSIVLRDVCENAVSNAEALRTRILEFGFPNSFGEQRFGREGETLHTGLQLLRGQKKSRDIRGRDWKFQLRLSLSAVQSMLFNTALTERLRDGLLGVVLAGDVMQVTASGGKFVVEDTAREQSRLDAGEIAVTGPIFGPKMHQPTGVPFEREAALLARHELTAEMFQQYRKLTSGTRRPYVVRVDDLAIEPLEHGLRFMFTLPPGSYATVLLREFQGVAEG